MLIIKRTTAWEELVNIIENFPESASLIKLADAIEDAGKTAELDNIVSYEFPNGVDIDELKEYFEDEQDIILEQLGVYPDSDEDDSYEDEDDE